jgi:Cys-tRNA(Pro)/Cys-tRNA(Cys) deacylase
MDESNSLHKNVQAAISGLGVDCRIYDHNKISPRIKSPQDFADALKYPIGRVTKTLFLRGHDGQTYGVAVCSIDRRLNFKLAAEALRVNRIETASAEDLKAKTGYPKNGVSPLGLAEGIAVVVDRPLLDYPTILVGGGAAAIEIEITPAALVAISRATVQCITS